MDDIITVTSNEYDAFMLRTIQKYYRTRQHADLVLTTQGQSFYCHRMMVSIIIPHVAELLQQHENKISHKYVLIHLHMKPWILQEILNYTYTGKCHLPKELKDEFFEVCKALGMNELATILRDEDQEDAANSLVQPSKQPVTATNPSRFKEEEYQYSSNQPNAAEQTPVANEQVDFDCKRYKAAVDGGSTNTRRFTPPLPTAIPTKTEVL